MSYIPSWRHEIHPRKCADCGKSCRDVEDRCRYYRETCPGCLEMFCTSCAEEHRLVGGDYCKGPACGRSAADYPGVPLGKDGRCMPGWKAALIQKHIPGAVMGGYCNHTAGWDLHFFVNMTDPDAAVISREAMEELCEALHATWHALPTAAMQPTWGIAVTDPPSEPYEIPPPPIPPGCEDGMVIHMSYVI